MKLISTVLRTGAHRYALVGGTAFVVEYASFYLLLRVWVTGPVIANVVSFLLGLAVSFTLNRQWGFAGGTYGRRASHQLALYGGVAICNVAASTALILLLTDLGVSALIGKLAAILLIASWNFFIFKHLIFKRQAS